MSNSAPETFNDVLHLKAELLAGCYVHVSRETLAMSEWKNGILSQTIDKENLYSDSWIFLRLSDITRVRMVAVSGPAPFQLRISNSLNEKYDIVGSESGRLIASGLELEKALFHCPKQLFFNLYQYCSIGCEFCPLSITTCRSKDNIEKISGFLDRFNLNELDGIGITSGIPTGHSSEEVALEMVELTKQIRTKIGSQVPIGVSPLQPSYDTLIKLREAGANELRINLEIANFDLAETLIPKKDLKVTLKSISNAVKIFGRGRVSSNLIMGIGETDEEITFGIEELAQRGAVATVYPYDPIPTITNRLIALTNRSVGRPNAKRIQKLAKTHKKILKDYDLYPSGLKTMCPQCAASHVMPGKDL